MPASAIIRRTGPRNSVTILLLAIAVSVSGCGDRIEGEIAQQLPRPGEGVTAILAIDRGHWVTSHVYYDVYLKSDKDGAVDRVFSVRDNNGAKMHWESSNILMLDIPCGEIEAYKNFWYSSRTGLVFVGLKGNRLCNPEPPKPPIPRVHNNELVLPK